MKKAAGFGLVVLFFLVSFAFAEYPDLVGTWRGDGTAILPDGTVIDGLYMVAEITYQAGGLFYAEFRVTVPGLGRTYFSGTGYIGEDNKLRAIWSIEGMVIGVADSTLDTSGSKPVLVGSALDFSDGSTSYFKIKKMK